MKLSAINSQHLCDEKSDARFGFAQPSNAEADLNLARLAGDGYVNRAKP
jgi:hypothetical protein